jgi:pilus assembly protein Flp/PilA
LHVVREVMSQKNFSWFWVAKDSAMVNREKPKTTQKRRREEMERIKNFFKDESGATAVEYGLMVALIAVVIIAAVRLLGTNLQNTFNNTASEIGGT